MLVACLGDVMLDVIVATDDGLLHDDDVPATITFSAGGQAANVAAWVSALGGRARVFGPRSRSGQGRLVEEALAAHRVESHGPHVSHPGSVMSLTSAGRRSMASDAGSSDWLDEVGPGPWLHGADWLFVSGYALLRSATPERIVHTADAAHEQGTRVAVDLASAAMIASFGANRFLTLWQRLSPDVVFATDDEWAATYAGRGSRAASSFGAGGTSVLVLKHAGCGTSFVIDGVEDYRRPVPGEVVDPTGAGDALAAGYLVGGVDLAMQVAARCVARSGAQPAPGDTA